MCWPRWVARFILSGGIPAMENWGVYAPPGSGRDGGGDPGVDLDPGCFLGNRPGHGRQVVPQLAVSLARRAGEQFQPDRDRQDHQVGVEQIAEVAGFDAGGVAKGRDPDRGVDADHAGDREPGRRREAGMSTST